MFANAVISWLYGRESSEKNFNIPLRRDGWNLNIHIYMYLDTQTRKPRAFRFLLLKKEFNELNCLFPIT